MKEKSWSGPVRPAVSKTVGRVTTRLVGSNPTPSAGDDYAALARRRQRAGCWYPQASVSGDCDAQGELKEALCFDPCVGPRLSGGSADRSPAEDVPGPGWIKRTVSPSTSMSAASA